MLALLLDEGKQNSSVWVEKMFFKFKTGDL